VLNSLICSASGRYAPTCLSSMPSKYACSCMAFHAVAARRCSLPLGALMSRSKAGLISPFFCPARSAGITMGSTGYVVIVVLSSCKLM
jgi:hypothetical protein